MFLLHTGHGQLGANQKVIAVDRYGGLAEHIVVDGRFTFWLPLQPDSATSTPLLSSGLTVFAGIRRAQLPAGSEWRCWAREGSVTWVTSSFTRWGTA